MPGIEREDHVVGLPAVPSPRGPDDDALADPQHREVRLPGVRPVRLVDQAGGEVPDGPQAEGLEVAELAVRLRDGVAHGAEAESTGR